MTRHTVVWSDDSERRLMQIWLGADDRSAVSAAAHRIDRMLRENAHLKGFDLHEGLRLLGFRRCV